ncbi:MAG: Holliday junction branch migration protein RuvA [Clostridia bacterium]|nr:Holliday junction branch migration protein RuvA [Clostridia bacterium]MBR4261725.1 Holliday junction branch migration protein RuvA [Clostridia bacterium]
MYAYIKGTLEIKALDYVVIETGGIGYKVFMSETAIDKLGEIGNSVKVYTYLKVREDDMSLYGFNTNEELRMFELLLSVSGVGAKSAIVILSNITPSSFALAVITDDVGKLKKLPGIGPKTAQRIILELKDKLKAVEDTEKGELEEMLSKKEADSEKVSEAMSALQVLGYSRKEIEKAFDQFDKKELSVEDIIKKGLLYLAK